MELADKLAMESIAKAHAENEIKDDLRPYRGRWVALRKGYVVADAADLEELVRDPRYLPGDMLELVSRFDSDLFL